MGNNTHLVTEELYNRPEQIQIGGYIQYKIDCNTHIVIK